MDVLKELESKMTPFEVAQNNAYYFIASTKMHAALASIVEDYETSKLLDGLLDPNNPKDKRALRDSADVRDDMVEEMVRMANALENILGICA